MVPTVIPAEEAGEVLFKEVVERTGRD
jgi:hypothetical protein